MLKDIPGALGLEKEDKETPEVWGSLGSGNSTRLGCAGGNHGGGRNGRKRTPAGLGGFYIWGSLPRPRSVSGRGKKMS